MAHTSKNFSFENALNCIEKQARKALLSYTEIGNLLDKNPAVIAQYAKADLIHPIQQGSRKLISMRELHLLAAYMYAAENYGCSYVACKILGGILEDSDIEPENYVSYLKLIEKQTNVAEDKIKKHVNSYKNRGIFQKQKIEQSKENLHNCSECSSKN